MHWPAPIGFLQLDVLWAIMAVGAAALVWTYVRNRQPRDAARKSKRSIKGILLQSAGFATVGFGPIRVSIPWSAPASLVATALVVILAGAAVTLFIASSAAMGKNWSVVARTRADHQLIRTGPFAVVRHPIYLSLLLVLLSMAIAFGHWLNLMIALPLFAAGTVIRIREEEKLLRELFGEDHARYVREVPAFIPLIG
jgi:protein-S-isoprenylcysteine O-methyltransferase Ste14